MHILTNILNIKAVNQVLLLIVANYIGSWSISLSYILGTRIFKFVDVETPDFNEALLFNTFLLHTYTTLLICAAFSISFLFLKDNMRYAFLLAPLVVPCLYGLVFLSRYAG